MVSEQLESGVGRKPKGKEPREKISATVDKDHADRLAKLEQRTGYTKAYIVDRCLEEALPVFERDLDKLRPKPSDP